ADRHCLGRSRIVAVGRAASAAWRTLLRTPSHDRVSTRATPAAIAIVVGLYLVIGATQIHDFHGLRHDDAFISFRYGQNLAEGHGLVFNRGQRVMGSTSPGQVLLSAVFYLLVGRDALPSVMAAIGCLAWLAQAIVLTLILRRALGGGAIFVGLFVA